MAAPQFVTQFTELSRRGTEAAQPEPEKNLGIAGVAGCLAPDGEFLASLLGAAPLIYFNLTPRSIEATWKYPPALRAEGASEPTLVRCPAGAAARATSATPRARLSPVNLVY